MYAKMPKAISTKIMIALLVVASVVTAALMFHTKIDRDRFVDAHEVQSKDQLALVGSTRLWQGSNGEFFNYDLRSFDGGESWVLVEFDDAGRMKSLGDVETQYPGLLEAIRHGRELAEIVSTVGRKA